MESFTLTLSSKKSVLQANYFPEIALDPAREYVLGLVQLLTYNSIPNIHPGCNRLKILHGREFTFPTGCYEIESLEEYAKTCIPSIKIKSIHTTLKCEVSASEDLDFSQPHSIGQLLGFSPQVLPSGMIHQSDRPVNIIKANVIRVVCNITTGSYMNNDIDHCLHEFYPTVPPGYKIVEVPRQVIYVPVTVKSISALEVRLLNERNEIVDFLDEEVTIRLHIKAI